VGSSARSRRKPRNLKFYSREAGTGSLGRPRIVGVSELERRPGRARGQGDGALSLAVGTWRRAPRCAVSEIAFGPYRSPDPTYTCGLACGAPTLAERFQDRGRATEGQEKGKNGNGEKGGEEVRSRPPEDLVNAAMLEAMGHELASIHRGSASEDVIAADFDAREEGLPDAVNAISDAIRREQKNGRSIRRSGRLRATEGY